MASKSLLMIQNEIWKLNQIKHCYQSDYNTINIISMIENKLSDFMPEFTDKLLKM